MHQIQARLEQQLHQAVERLRQLGGAIVIEDVPTPVLGNSDLDDSVDEIQMNGDLEISWATRSLLVERANKLAEALERLRKGVYGSCEECGEPIAPARLTAMPEVTTCVRCQDRIEREALRPEPVKAVFGVAEDDDE